MSNPAAGSKQTVSESCTCHWQSMKTNLEFDDSVLEYFKDLRNEGVKALMSKARECTRNSNTHPSRLDMDGMKNLLRQRTKITFGI